MLSGQTLRADCQLLREHTFGPNEESGPNVRPLNILYIARLPLCSCVCKSTLPRRTKCKESCSPDAVCSSTTSLSLKRRICTDTISITHREARQTSGNKNIQRVVLDLWLAYITRGVQPFEMLPISRAATRIFINFSPETQAHLPQPKHTAVSKGCHSAVQLQAT